MGANHCGFCNKKLKEGDIMSKKSLSELSPFEFKDELIKLATSNHDQLMLNAGRGNPNFLATLPRHAFLRLGDFALHESERSYSYLSAGFGGMPEKKDLLNRFDAYALHNEHIDGIDFIRSSLAFAEDHLGMDKEALLHELVMAFLGCNYPVPPRMLILCEQIVKNYLSMELCGTTTQADKFDVFATEGGTAAMAYLFESLASNGLLKPGDKVAMITPIFSPYLEIPCLPKYGLEIVEIKADEDLNWQVPTAELEKLLSPEIKLLFMVNPTNPTSVKLSNKVLSELAGIVNDKRQDLMIVTDDVYATFSDDFRSLFSVCPYNTLCVYSFSKYFGVTGWRLGTMLLHEKNIFDDLLAALSKTQQQKLDQRYKSLTDDPKALKFIDRLVADSRAVALNHTAGISTPQQLQMTLLAFTSLLDENRAYQAEAKRIIRRRYDILYRAIGLTPEVDENSVDYYTVIDLERLGETLYNAEFVTWLLKKYSAADFIIRLAKETSVVLLPGKGFDVDHPSARVSLANLTEYDYRKIGAAVKLILQEYYQQFSA
jgi:aspartate 4-decarboxylase